jgi:hypothetical protein
MGRLKDFAVDFNGAFKNMEGGGGGDADQIIDSFKKKLDEALSKHGLK